MKQVVNAWSVLLLFTGAVVSHGRKIVQDHRAAIETDADKEFGAATLQRFEAKAMQLLAHLESKINSVDTHRVEQDAPQIVTIPQTATLPARNTSHPMEMFEGCKASSPVEALLRRASHVHEEETQEAVNESTLGARCALYQMPMTYYRWDKSTASSSCCDSRSKDCSGCEKMGSGKCTVRESAFVKLKGDDMHTACMDIVWVNGKGKTCQQLSSADCNFRFQGTSSREACCKCGGGVKTATSFKYDDHTYILGEQVSMWPQPRTATRYGLNEDCEFAMYNLTLNGATGEVSFIKGAGKPKEPFRISCKVTAFQPHHLFFTATVTVAMAELSYGPSLLLFTAKTKSYTLQKFSPPKSHWKDFQMMCAPDAKWVTMDKTGDLKLAEAKETGAVDIVKDLYKGQTGTVCHVFALLRKSPTAEWEKKTVDFILVKPKPATKLSYSTSLIASSISQVVPPVLPVPFKEGDMAPNAYTMRCDKAGFTFDSLHGIGFYDGHPLMELQPNGQLSLNIGPSFVHIFDSMGSSKHNRKIGLLDLKLKCRIFGSFGDPELEPISARMDIVVSDSTCWVQEKMPYRNIRRWHGVNSHAECQNICRNTASCSHYRYIRRGRGSANAYCYDTKRAETRSTSTVWSKVPDCNPMNTCVKVDAPTWLERGIYCPVGYDIDRQSMTYLKDGKTPKETIYLRRYKAGVDRTVDGCNSGGWLLQEKNANDFVSLSKGVFEFSGPLVGCKVKGVSYTGLPCEQPGNITEEGADMQPIILDDPNTEDPADFWLHPCDCASKMWGDKPPVDPQVFAQMPPESPDEFVPSPMVIVEGQFVCPPGYMLGDGPLFESDIESMEVGDCEIRCKNNDDCHFFWHGSQHSANTCRLYSRCNNLLREPGVEGVLKAVPRSPVCLVNNPEMCWTKSMRRYALTSQQPPSEFQFLYWNLHAQCDYMLLLGGWGVSACTRPSHRTLKSHRWKHKRLLPEEFAHGTRLKATCWNERYKGIRLGIRGDEVATCVSGSWFSSSNLPGFGDFSCVGCVQVGTSGFGDVETKRQQELYYFNKLALSIHSEVNPIADAKVNCMEPVRPKAGQETSLPEDLKKVHTFDLKGHDFTIMNDVIGDKTLWTNSEASKNKYTYQSLPEALAACAVDSDCWFVSRSEGTKVGLALRRFDLRKGNMVRFVGAKTWVKSIANPCIGNCAALRPVKCGPGVSACGRSLVDGRKAGSLWKASPHASSHHCHQKKWVQIDLGSIKEFDQVKVFGYADGRRYCGHSILVSNNEKDWRHVYVNNGWKAHERGQGNTFNLGSQVGRYVRIYASRSTSNTGIHLLEIEIYRAAVHQPKLPGSHWITDQHVKELRAKARKPSILQDGLVMYYYYGQSHCNVPDLGKLTPEHYVIVPKVSGFPGIRQHDHFCVRCVGFVNIRRRGHYYFYTSSDDGSLLYLNGHLIVNNNGCHGNQQRGSTRRWLEKGRHRLMADMCENAWGEYFEVRYKGPDTGNHLIAIPRSALKYEKAATEVELKDGAECNYYYGRHDCNVPNLDNLNPSHIVTVPEIYMDRPASKESCLDLPMGDRFIQLGEWRLGEFDANHFSISHKGGKTAQIFRKDGTLHPGPRNDFGTWNRQIGTPSGIKFGTEYVEIGAFRLGAYDATHLSISHKDGKTEQIFRADGTLHPGPRNDFGTYRNPSQFKGISVGDRYIQIGKFRVGDVDGKHFTVVSETKTIQIYRSDGTQHPGPRTSWQQINKRVPWNWCQSKFTEINQADNFCARCTAQVAITKEGHYKFTTASDDGSLMYLNGQQIVDNNGCHGERERTSSNQWLTPGYHLVQVDMCENRWGEALKLRYQGPDTGNRKVKVSKSVLKHEKAGLECKYFYHRHHCSLPDLGRLHAHHTVTVPDIWMDSTKFPAHRHRDAFCMRCSGYLVIRRAGHYRFWTASDDGSFLFIGGHRVVDNNGCHGPQERSSNWRWLHTGKHRLTADVCEHAGGESFKVMYQGPDTGNRKIKIPKESLLKPGKATNTKAFQALDTVTADFRQHGTLKSGKIVFSKHSEKITCKIFCDDVLVHEEYHNHIGHKDREVNIPEICKGARKVKLQGGASNGGTCGFKSNKLELFKFMPTRTLTRSQVSTIKDRAASCRARYSASGQVTIKLDDYGEIAPGNKVNFGHHKYSKCEVHCNGKKQTVYSGRRRHRHRKTFDVSKECIGATTMVLKGGGKCGGCQIDKGHLKVSPYPTHPSEVVIPAKKIVAWFKSEDAGPTWRSSVGKFTASARRRTGVVAYKARGYGAKTPIRYIQGHTGHHFDFGKVLQDHYTVCSVTRYLSAGATGRILTGSKSNYIHGHHGAGVGLSYANGWQTPTGLRKKSTKWVTTCASPGAKYVFVDGVDVGTRKTDYYLDQHLEINGRLWHKEKSDWAVAELIAWNYILTREQMKEASTYLMKKLMVGGEMDACKVILKQPEHWRDQRGSYNKQVLNRLRLHKSTKRVDLALDSTSGWCSPSNHGHQWVEIDLRATEKVMGIIIQTFHKSDDYVFAFKVQYKASEKGSWRTIPNRFTGMTHKTEDHVRAYFAEAVEARFVRLTSFWWHRNICLRAAVMLCKTHLDNEVNLLQARTCPTNYNSESWSESDSGSRHLRIGGSPDCLHVTQTKKRMALLSATCDGDDVHQMIPSSDVGYLFTMLHRNSWLQDNVLLPGIKAEYFYNLKADHCVIPDLTWRAPDKVEVLPMLDFWKKTSWSGLKHNDKFSARMSGVLMINEPGWYEFWLWADDSSRIFLNHKEIGSLGGCGGTRHRYVKRKLTMGSWPIELQFYESVGQASLRLEYRGPDTHKKKRIVPGTAFAHMADKTQWMPTSAIARGCIGNTALGSLQPDMFLVSDLAKGVPVDCRFVPLLSKELPVQIATTRSFKDNNWPLWWEDLESWEMACPEGKVLQSLDMLNVNNKLQVKYTCATASGLGQCYPGWTDQQDAHEFKDSVLSKSILKRLHIVCPQHDLLSAVHFEYSEGGLWARFKYVCCKEAGAPVAMVSKGPDHARVNRLEGTYCPEKVGSSGRLDYIQKAWGSWQTKKLAKLTFSEVSGKWCIGSDCSSPGDNVEPMGLQLGGFDATEVSDFDGKFEAKGVKPNTGGLLGQSPVPKVKPPPPPRRPKAPKKPKLETFEPEMPKYSDKCVGYGDLWKKVQETTVNEAGEEESNAEELETEEESQSGYKAMHPCDLAASYGGVRSKWAGGDGKAIPKPMPYNELMGCLDRDGATSFKGQEIVRHLDFIIEGMNLPAAIASTTCTFAPEILTAPMGFGASADLADICKGIVHSVTAGVKLLKYAGSEILRSQINKAAAADCDATQANFARMFCDVHCVRDAVIRGDRTILRNLKKATDITNGNTAKLAEWIVKTQQLDVSWLAEKIDHQSVVQSLESTKQFTNIKELLTGGDKKELFLAIKQQTIKLQSELRGYVDGASFGKASLLAASDALEKFNGNSKSVLQDGNSTEQVFGAFDSLVSLRAKLRTASDQRSRVDHVAMSVTQGARQMQQQLKLQHATLGIYRENGNRTLQAARQRSSLATSERHAMVLDLDRIWWKIRGAVDSYVDEAENEINSFESGSQAMANYQQCSMDFASLLSIYRHTMAVTDSSHRALKKTWRLCSNLIGELASHLDDGEAFVTFLQQEGCASPLAFQTLEQVRDVMGSLRMLYHRFAVSGLASPELSFVESTVDRIKKTWSSAQAVVCNRTGQLPIWYLMPVDTEKALEQLEAMQP